MDLVTMLKATIGKKLVWVSHDELNEETTFVFEDLEGFKASAVVPLAGRNFVEHYLEHEIRGATNIMALQDIYKKATTQEKTDERVDAAQSPAPESSGAPATGDQPEHRGASEEPALPG